MTTATATPEVVKGSAAINAGLARYARAKGSRRDVRRLLGDADPDYNLTDFLFCIATGQAERLTKHYDTYRTKSPLSVSGGGASGGYLVPLELRLDLMADVAEGAFMRPRATVVPMSSSMVNLSLPDAGTAPTASGISPFFGGIQMLWTEEATTRTETEPGWRSVELKAWELSGYALESNTMLADGGKGVESWIRKLFARSLAWYEDYAYLQGNGVGKPMGIINAPGTATVTRHSSTAFDNPNDVATMTKSLLPSSWPRAMWLVSPSVWSQIVILGGGASGVSPSFQVNQPIVGSRDLEDYRKYGQMPFFTLAGMPGYVSEKLPALGTKGDVILFDPLLYVIGDRGAVEIDISLHEPTAFKNNQAVWRIVYRGDGQPWFSKTITLADASTAVAPYVVLV